MTEKQTKIPAKTSKKTLGLSVPAFGIGGKAGKAATVPSELFDVEASDKLLAQYIRVYLANQRQGTNKVKTRSEVQGTTKKTHRQKGTGRARHGARTAPIFVGGGVTFGPELRPFRLKINKKQRQKALYYALSLKLKADKLMSAEGISKLTGKTKDATDLLKNLNIEDPRGTLFVYAKGDDTDKVVRSIKNVPEITATEARLLNAYDVLKARTVVFSSEALRDFIDFRGFGKKV